MRTIKTCEIAITGMSCAACSARIEKVLSRKQGIDSAGVNLATERARVRYDDTMLDDEAVYAMIRKIGYGAERYVPVDPEIAAKEREKKLKAQWIRFVIAACLAAPMVVGMVVMMAGIHALDFLHNPWVQLVLATPVQIVIGWPFYRNAYKALRGGAPNMDVLIVLGTSAAYLFSVYNLYLYQSGGGVDAHDFYFEASAVIIALVLLGRYFEAKAKGRASDAIRKLMRLAPDTARLVRGGNEEDVPVSQIVPGDAVRIRAGERVPLDGEIIEGTPSLDESVLTGESMPVDKSAGDSVFGATVNGNAPFIMRVTRVGGETALSRIVAAMEEAQGVKAPIQKTADKVAGIFVPSVLVIAAVTFVLWLLFGPDVRTALVNAVSVLVIACPCSLGLATPTAILVGTGVGAQHGILIKGGEQLETAHRVRVVALDKTGTVTLGKPAVTDIVPMGGYHENEVLALAAAAELASEHPLGAAICERARALPSLPSAVGHQIHPGKGVSATVDGKAVLVGTRKLLAEAGVDAAPCEAAASRLEAEGKTAMLVAVEGAAAAVLAVADPIRPTSCQAVSELRAMGVDAIMLTGDNPTTAQAIADSAGIARVHAGVLPEGKAEAVAAMKQDGALVAMVGDGINDAPALATADVGIAMRSGSDIAMEAAGIALVRSDPLGIPAALRLSRATMRKIRQNLFWAFFYNAVGIPFAALGFLSPIIAGAAMAFSSVSVVTNSLSLKRCDPTQPTQSEKKKGSDPT